MSMESARLGLHASVVDSLHKLLQVLNIQLCALFNSLEANVLLKILSPSNTVSVREITAFIAASSTAGISKKMKSEFLWHP